MSAQRISDREEIGLAAFMEGRVERSHRRGRKRLPQSDCVLPRTAEHLIRRIVKATADGSETWAEANDEVARGLHVDRSTVVRMARRMCEVGILTSVETKGGRGHVSVYRVDRCLAEEALCSRRWPVDAPNQRTEETQEQVQEAGQREEPAQRMPPFDKEAPSGQVPPAGDRHDHDPESDRSPDGSSFLDSLDPSVLAYLAGKGGSANDPLSTARIRQWWEAQPETVRRAIGATAAGATLVTVAAFLGGWRAAGIAALVTAPAVIAYALHPRNNTVAVPAGRPETRPLAEEAADTGSLDPLFQALAGSPSRSSS